MPMIFKRLTCVIDKGEYTRKIIHYSQVTDTFWSLLHVSYPWIERKYPLTTSIFLDFASHQYDARVSVLHPQSELSYSSIYSCSTVNSLCDKYIYILNWWLHSAAFTHTNTAFCWTSESFCAAWLQGLRDLGEYAFSQTVHVSWTNL